MKPLEFDDQFDGAREKNTRRKPNKKFDEHVDRVASRQKRSGKRFHRKKTLKDEFWVEDDYKERSRQ